jgi:hypothetical protein
MRVRLVRDWRHPRAELACRALGWRAVGRRVMYACAAAAACGAGGAYAAIRGASTPGVDASDAAGTVLLVAGAVALLWLAHLVNGARTPVTFKVGNGELVVTRPFLFGRRSRTLKTADVRAVTVSPGLVGGAGVPGATGRLSIRRRYRLPLRVPGRRPLDELDRVAQELRSVLRV